MRLAGGETEAEGRLEICGSKRWGTVCDNQWTVNHTAVVCRHLGFSDTFSGQCGSNVANTLLKIKYKVLFSIRFNLLHV